MPSTEKSKFQQVVRPTCHAPRRQRARKATPFLLLKLQGFSWKYSLWWHAQREPRTFSSLLNFDNHRTDRSTHHTEIKSKINKFEKYILKKQAKHSNWAPHSQLPPGARLRQHDRQQLHLDLHKHSISPEFSRNIGNFQSFQVFIRKLMGIACYGGMGMKSIWLPRIQGRNGSWDWPKMT